MYTIHDLIFTQLEKLNFNRSNYTEFDLYPIVSSQIKSLKFPDKILQRTCKEVKLLSR